MLPFPSLLARSSSPRRCLLLLLLRCAVTLSSSKCDKSTSCGLGGIALLPAHTPRAHHGKEEGEGEEQDAQAGEQRAARATQPCIAPLCPSLCACCCFILKHPIGCAVRARAALRAAAAGCDDEAWSDREGKAEREQWPRGTVVGGRSRGHSKSEPMRRGMRCASGVECTRSKQPKDKGALRPQRDTHGNTTHNTTRGKTHNTH